MATFGFKRVIAFRLAALIAAVVLSAPAMAEDASSPDPSKWVKLCQPDPATKQESCMVMQRLLAATGQLLATAAIRQVAGDAKMRLIASVPLGVSLRAGLRAQIDDGKPLALKYGICFPDACYAQLDIDEAVVNALKAGGKLTVIAANRKGQSLAFAMTLAGFTKAYNGDGVDAATGKELFDQLAQIAREEGAARTKLAAQQQTGAVTSPAQ